MLHASDDIAKFVNHQEVGIHTLCEQYLSAVKGRDAKAVSARFQMYETCRNLTSICSTSG